MPKITEVVFGYKPDITLMKAMQPCLRPGMKEPEGVKVEMELCSGALRLSVRLPGWDRDKIVMWEPKTDVEDGVPASLALSVSVLNEGDLERSYQALMVIVSRAS